MMIRRLSLCAALMAASSPAAAGGYSLALPLHTPPRLRPEAGKSSFALGAGWASLHGSGLALSGPGGGWEFATASPNGLGAALHSEGYALKGTLDPSGAGRLNTTGLAGSIEGDFVWSPSGVEGPWRLYLGAQASLSLLNMIGTRSLIVASGPHAVEPNGAYSVLVGFPVGASVGGSLGNVWTGQAGANVATCVGGVTFYHYFLRGPHLYGKSQEVTAHAAAGGYVRAEYAPWRISLEAGGSAAARSGNSRGLASLWTQAAWSLF